MKVNRDRIKALMDQVREIHESPENQARARYWQVVPHERWEPALIRTLPAPRAGAAHGTKGGDNLFLHLPAYSYQRLWCSLVWL